MKTEVYFEKTTAEIDTCVTCCWTFVGKCTKKWGFSFSYDIIQTVEWKYIALKHLCINPPKKIVPNKCTVSSCLSNVCQKLRCPGVSGNYYLKNETLNSWLVFKDLCLSEEPMGLRLRGTDFQIADGVTKLSFSNCLLTPVLFTSLLLYKHRGYTRSCLSVMYYPVSFPQNNKIFYNYTTCIYVVFG